MAKPVLLLVLGALFFAFALADLVAHTQIASYILLLAGLAVGVWAVRQIQKKP